MTVIMIDFTNTSADCYMFLKQENSVLKERFFVFINTVVRLLYGYTAIALEKAGDLQYSLSCTRHIFYKQFD